MFCILVILEAWSSVWTGQLCLPCFLNVNFWCTRVSKATQSMQFFTSVRTGKLLAQLSLQFQLLLFGKVLITISVLPKTSAFHVVLSVVTSGAAGQWKKDNSIPVMFFFFSSEVAVYRNHTNLELRSSSRSLQAFVLPPFLPVSNSLTENTPLKVHSGNMPGRNFHNICT